ncbi:MAG TPA: hypothetical protein GX738_04720, partial [Firmicutes bacterium]|nr:hypothetical protein [Bacillota bacterium]
MRDILTKGLDMATQLGASYADIRVTKRETEQITAKNGHIENLTRGGNEGFGVRVLKNGAWGFAATPILQEGDLEKKIEAVVNKAVAIAQAASRVNRSPVKLAPVESVRTTYITPTKIDPFAMPLEQKLQDLTEITKALACLPEIRVTTAGLRLFKEQKTF